ncbi:phage baseplate assembly protein V, partial [Hymenobacter terrenus]|uniref:phage baseplate assembly protein V n=1 Tax=Hymenobacter terrenus TaxID=1629124 RepID=UPI0006199C96
YRITQITHYVDEQGNYENAFAAVVHSVVLPPPNPLVRPPLAEPELADVVDLHDPQQLGRVRVRYHWPVENPQFAESGWLRVSTPYSGDGKGQLFTPEVGSQVLVGYELHRPERPLVLGNVFHAKNAVQGTYSHPDNQVKSIRTKGG